jgi:GDP-L-fucose synthase
VNKNKVTILGNGLVGNSIAETLSVKNYDVRATRSTELDLLDPLATERFISELDVNEVVVFAAGLSGGISFNLNNPFELYTKNIGMINNFIGEAAKKGIKRVVNIVPACVYPANLDQRAKVEDLWQGPMEKSSLAYSTAKISGLVGVEAVRKQLGLDWTNLIVTNVYGPNKSIDSKQMHVIPALIEKINQAKASGDKSVQILGDGTPVREFLYSSDLGLAVHSFIQNDLWSIPTMNIAGSEAVSILELAKIIAHELGYKGEIRVEASSNNGTSIKLLDDSIFRKTGWEPKVDLAQGISHLTKLVPRSE